ncbi:non-ribosomal peptide synthetase [Nocardia asteroides NBRC 15531]|uniref:Phenyloxazoline synthase MbtB n=2 Tax=Nocardia asteroides TaxID=1824 RepID=U5ECJ2_NOCAS|nr:non-ribosomal peptide synthetase [Nocardia asteroides]TLF65305.1 non-ribosomal peptide synthetase [Nocardia asteroides NBRC 15531]UGT47948.1 non-ribosomal peptide synthetase [Nocardia asteroides]SFM60178.1 mycobactin phenyloxazoline synthetase [Nocardia asteroides]VEG33117.1 Phenyloxazoline synthase MbtB [Nocardia asteroides]BAO99078.1 non-ribosomal peptide synthetase [Nocardia asteroides]
MDTAPDGVVIDRAEIRAAIARHLDLTPEEVADATDLIQLGLDSIRTMKLAGGWRKRGIAVNFALLAAHPTVDAWFALLNGGDPENPPAEPSAPAAPADDSDSPATESVIVPDDGTPFALAPMQHAYWIGRSDGQELGGVAAHLYVEFDGAEVDPERLERAVEQLLARHPMLRTRFLPDGTQQTMDRPGRPVYSVADLRGLPVAEAEQRLEELRAARTHQRMAVQDGQVIDIALSRLAGGRTRLHLDVDMLAADAMSYRVLITDLARLYHGEQLPPQDYTFRQYLAEHPAGTGDEHARDRAWWQDRLGELPGSPELPQSPHIADPSRTVRLHRWLSPEAKVQVFDAAHARGITPAMALASVFAETIGGWSAQRRFLLNLPLFHREPVHPQVDGVVGDFTSSVLLEVDVTEPATVADRALALQQRLHEAGAHSAYSGLEVLRDLGRHRGEPVLAPIVYTSALNLGELFADTVTETFGEPVWIISQGPQVLLDAQITEVRGGLLLNWDIRESAFPAGMVETMFTRYIDAIERLGHAGWQAEAGVRIPVEQAATRARVNATAGPVSGGLLHTGFFANAATNPSAPAVIWEPAGQLTYGELAADALAVAGALREAGVAPGDSVAVQLPKGPDQVVAVLGVLAAGAVYVPIGFDQPAARRAEILRTADAVAVLTVGGAQIPDARAIDLAEARQHAEPLARPVFGDPENIAYVLFTSGSTGKPKGVEVPHRAAMNTIDDLNERFGLGAGDRALALSALEFDLSVYDIFGLLAVGGAVVAVDDTQRADPARWVELIRRHRVSMLNCVPSLLDMLLTATAGETLPSLRTVILGGDWVDVALPARLAAVAPECRFAGLGGATETAIHSTICEVVGGQVPAEWGAVPYGTPLRNVQCRVVGPAGNDCPDWVTGELWIGGDGVAAGYRADPERTADRFVTHEGLRWYRTGDLARYLPDGGLEFLGRADHQVKIRGYRVELGEVESALRAVPGIRHAVAAVVGTAAPKLVAAIVATPGTALDPDAVLTATGELVPAYMVPTRLELLAELPLTSNAKPDRKAVRAVLERGETATEFVAPRTDLERALAAVVGEVLGVERIGVTDDFFALGGDSVLATTAVARVREWLDAPDTVVADLFTARGVAGLAARMLERETAAGATGRLDAVAAMYLEVAAMTDEEILAQS